MVDSCPYVIGIVRLLGRKWLVGHIIDLLGAVQSHPSEGGGWSLNYLTPKPTEGWTIVGKENSFEALLALGEFRWWLA